MAILETAVNYDYLIEDLRIHLGDLDATAYRYLDSWLRSSLCMAIKGLQRWWNFKYLLDDTTFDVSRNPNITFLFPSPPIIEHEDERPIILYASILIKGGSLENNSWNVGSWRDAEISYSNIEGNRAKVFGLERDMKELNSLLTSPDKRLAYPLKRSLPGYIDNSYERKGRH